MGAIFKDRVELLLRQRPENTRNSRETLLECINAVTATLENDQDLFVKLLLTMPERIQDVLNASGRPTKW